MRSARETTSSTVCIGPAAWVAVWVPGHAIAKADAMRAYAAGARDAVAPLADLVRAGRLGEAMTRNGDAFLRLYRDAGLPVDAAPIAAALGAGGLGAGLSGTGPAVAALFPTRRPLAETMIKNQSGEVDVIRTMLTELGAAPLP